MRKPELVLQVVTVAVGMMLNAGFAGAAEELKAEAAASIQVQEQAQVQGEAQVQGQAQVQGDAQGQKQAQGAGPDAGAKPQGQARSQKRVYGTQLMSPRERAEYYTKLRSMKTVEEREAFRLENHKKMQDRAKEQGIMLHDTPPAESGGMGTGGGKGAGGMGPSSGAGGSRGR